MATAAKKRVVKTPTPERVNKTYKLIGKTPISYTINTGRGKSLLVFDEDKGYERAIRHCPNDKSIYVDEQEKYALVEDIVFINGILIVDKSKQMTQKFMDTVPSNGRIFAEVNKVKEAEDMIAETEAKAIINMAIIAKAKEDGGINHLQSVVAVLKGSYDVAMDMEKEELKNALYIEVRNNPYNFIDDYGNVTMFDDEYTIRKFLAMKALKLQIIERTSTGSSIRWKNGDVIFQSPSGRKILDSFTEYLGTDDGIIVLKEMKDRM